MPLQPLQLPPVPAVPHVDAAVLSAARQDVGVGPGVRVQDEGRLRRGEGVVPSVDAERGERRCIQHHELDRCAERRRRHLQFGLQAAPDARPRVDQQQPTVAGPPHAEDGPAGHVVQPQRDLGGLLQAAARRGQLEDGDGVALHGPGASERRHLAGRRALRRRGLRAVAVVVRRSERQPQPRQQGLGALLKGWQLVDLHLLGARAQEVDATSSQQGALRATHGPPHDCRVDVERDGRDPEDTPAGLDLPDLCGGQLRGPSGRDGDAVVGRIRPPVSP
mmetsp:Transcript_4083/g.11830  ORF Transcript_4083/g.11830 Transcript_4083/m.11830 type:complete len:277 (+) Transcript_4083:120-950(+)